MCVSVLVGAIQGREVILETESFKRRSDGIRGRQGMKADPQIEDQTSRYHMLVIDWWEGQVTSCFIFVLPMKK